MEEELDIIAGLDIGTNAVKIAIAQHSNACEKSNIIALESTTSLGVSKGVINNIHATSEKIASLIYNISKQCNIELNAINLSIKDPNIKSLQHKYVINRSKPNQAISSADIGQLINDAYELAVPPGKTIFYANPTSYNLDNESNITNPIGRLATHLEAYFNISLGDTTVLHKLYKCMDLLKLHTDEIIFSPIATGSAVLTNEEKEAGVALINIGSESVEIAIFHEGILKHINIIPIGSNLITNDIAEALQILPKQAENIKIQYGSALASLPNNEVIPVTNIRGEIFKTITSKDLNYIVQIRAEEILECIIEDLMHSKIVSKLLGGIVFVGGGAKLRYIDILAKHMFSNNIPIRIGNPAEQINSADKLKALDPSFATAIGLIINHKNNIKNSVTISKQAEVIKKKSANWFEKIIKKTLISDLLNNDIKDKDFIK